jgi:hypothetical protein
VQRRLARAPDRRDNGEVIDGDPMQSVTSAMLERAGHLAVLRILAQQRQEDLDRLAEEADAVARRGYVLDAGDALARVEHARDQARLSRRLSAAASDLHEAEAALREAILDDAWTPSDDLGGWPFASESAG